MYKYEILARELENYLDSCRQQGMEVVTLCARDIEHNFHVSERCGAKKNSRYPLICQAMHYVRIYPGTIHPGPDPSSTFTITYQLKKRKWFFW